jgi:RNA polymerase sigma-70 factor (ECF subfamily)
MAGTVSKLHPIGLTRHSTEDLLLLIQDGDALAFECFYNRTSPTVRNFVRCRGSASLPIDDIIQEVFCRVWQQKGRFVPRSSGESFLIGIARNVLREFYRVLDKAVSLDYGLGIELPEAESQRSWCEDLMPYLAHARLMLSKRQEAAIRFVFDEQMDHHEAAKRLGCSLQALRRRLQEARRKLFIRLNTLPAQHRKAAVRTSGKRWHSNAPRLRKMVGSTCASRFLQCTGPICDNAMHTGPPSDSSMLLRLSSETSSC